MIPDAEESRVGPSCCTLGNTRGEERQIAARWIEQRRNVSRMTISVATLATKSHCARRNPARLIMI